MAKATTIEVTPQDLMKASEYVSQTATAYKKEYGALYQDIEALHGKWEGQDKSNYKSRLDGFKDDFENMYNRMVEYSTYLSDTGKAYQKTQQDIADATSSLSMGN